MKSLCVNITTFTNPFSFFCIIKGDDFDNNYSINSVKYQKIEQFNHGEHIAVLWRNKWVRGILKTDTQYSIWLMDYGIHIRPDNGSLYTKLPQQFVEEPSNVFEASIQGVVPVEKVLGNDCQIQNVISSKWSPGAIVHGKELIASATSCHLVPLAVLLKENNNVVLGDLYLDIPDKGIVNLADELSKWPFFLEKNLKCYVDDIGVYYEHGSLHKTKLNIRGVDLPMIKENVNLVQYSETLTPPKFEDITFETEPDSMSEDLDVDFLANEIGNLLTLVPSKLEKYSNMHIEIGGKKHNLLSLMIAKSKELKRCVEDKEYFGQDVGESSIYCDFWDQAF